MEVRRQVCISSVDAEFEVEDGDAQHDVLSEEEADEGSHDHELTIGPRLGL